MSSRVKIIVLLVFILSLFCQTLSANAAQPTILAEVTGDIVNVREGAGTEFPSLGKIYKGEQIQIIKSENNWYQFSFKGNQLGYVASWLVKPINSTPAITLPEKHQVYLSPSLRAQKTGVLTKDSKVLSLKEINGWYQIQSESLVGWVYQGLLKAESKVPSAHVNVYSKPSTRSEVTVNLTKGNTIQISREINGWYYISSGSKSGWIYKTHLINGSPDPIKLLNSPAIVFESSLKVYESPSLRSSSVGSLKKNTPITITKEINGWSEIKSSTLNGWVYKGLLLSNDTVKANNVNVYEKPSTRSTVSASLKSNDAVQISEEINGWYYISSSEIKGWVYKTHLKDGSPAPIEVIQSNAIVLPNNLIVYDKPSLRANKMKTLSKNSSVKIHSEINGWFQIGFPGSTGWVYKGLLLSDQKVTASKVFMYEKPSLKANQLFTLNQNEFVKISSEINGWYYVNSNNKLGWVYHSHLKDGSPEQEKQLSIPAIVKSSSLDTYASPSLRAEKTGSFKKNTPVIIQKEINGWYQIKVDNKTTWVYRGLLNSNIKVQNGSITVYEGPSTRGNIVDSLGVNQELYIISENTGWYEVKYNEFKTGWIYSGHLQTGSPAIKKTPAVSIKDNVQVYKNSNLSSEVIHVINSSEKVEIIREVDSFYYVILANKLTGWITKEAIVPFSGKVTPLLGKTIVIDPGHGGYDSGAIGKAYGTFEKNINLQTSLLLQSKLAQYGVNVVLTRSTDIYLDLPSRVKVSHNHLADAFISVHYNSSVSTSARGIETLYYTYAKDYSLANLIQQEMIKKTNFTNRGTRYQNLHVTRENQRPSVLVELGFLSNSIEESIIRTDSFRNNVSDGIVNGLINYFSN
ncbi:SH3 domain-containing protein [Bacillus sp. PAMC26568]|nr:SH3 domain-containing protein [Bacillus sp. PAMC26568]